MIELIAQFRAKPGKEAQLREATLAVVEPTRREPGCRSFVVHEDLERPGWFFIRETWNSEADLADHFAQPYLQELVALHEGLLDGELTLHKLEVF